MPFNTYLYQSFDVQKLHRDSPLKGLEDVEVCAKESRFVAHLNLDRTCKSQISQAGRVSSVAFQPHVSHSVDAEMLRCKTPPKGFKVGDSCGGGSRKSEVVCATKTLGSLRKAKFGKSEIGR